MPVTAARRAWHRFARWLAQGGAAGPGAPFSTALGAGDFAALQTLVRREAGIWIPEAHRVRVTEWIALRARALGDALPGAYLERLATYSDERLAMLDAISVAETAFFRERRHWEFLERAVYPRLRAEAEQDRRPKRIRAWSVACAGGEEPFSIALSLLAGFPPASGWQHEVLATDPSAPALERAEQATWPVSRAVEIPDDLCAAFMVCGSGRARGTMQAGAAMRAIVRFRQIDITAGADPDIGRFDLVFGGDILLYVDAATRDRVVARLVDHLAPAGHLFAADAGRVSGSGAVIRNVAPSVYERSATESADRRPHLG